MWLIATEVFLGTSLFFLKSIQIPTNFERAIFPSKLTIDKQLLEARLTSKLVLPADRTVKPLVIDAQYITINKRRNSVGDREAWNTPNSYDFDAQVGSFAPGVASWKTQTKFGLLAFDGKFDSQANFNVGNASWKLDTTVGVVDLKTKLNEQLKLIETTASWHADTTLGGIAVVGSFNDRISFTGAKATWNSDTTLGAIAIVGNFDRDTDFVGGNAAWNADTALGEIAIEGNFDERTDFTGGNALWNADTALGTFEVKGNFDSDTKFAGGNIKLATESLIGSLDADIKIDEETNFQNANASWNTNLLFGSSLKVNSRFDETTSFAGGSVKLGIKINKIDMGIAANLDADTHLTSGSAFWKTKAGLGSIGLDANIKRDGNFESKFNLEFPF